MQRLIEVSRSIIVAMDVEDRAKRKVVAQSVEGVPGISGFKFGIEAGLDGLMHSIDDVQIYAPNAVFIYDHQKAGNDIPPMGVKFARKLKDAGCHAAILFPFAGPDTQRAWTDACLEAGLQVLIGGVMTHSKFLVSEGGYIADESPERIFKLGCEQGVTNFVVPGTKLHWVQKLRALLEERLGSGNFDLHAPGFISQGGDITECGLAAGPRFHAIVGTAVYDKPTSQEQRAAALQVTRQIAA